MGTSLQEGSSMKVLMIKARRFVCREHEPYTVTYEHEAVNSSTYLL